MLHGSSCVVGKMPPWPVFGLWMFQSQYPHITLLLVFVPLAAVSGLVGLRREAAGHENGKADRDENPCQHEKQAVVDARHRFSPKAKRGTRLSPAMLNERH